MTLSFTAVQIALRAQLLTLAQLPAMRVWENDTDAIPSAAQSYIEESFTPAPGKLRGLVKSGLVESTGLYTVRWFAPVNTKLAVGVSADAVLGLFPPGLALTASDGTVVRVRTDIAPWRGNVLRADPGRVACTITIPWQVFTLSAP